MPDIFPARAMINDFQRGSRRRTRAIASIPTTLAPTMITQVRRIDRFRRPIPPHTQVAG